MYQSKIQITAYWPQGTFTMRPVEVELKPVFRVWPARGGMRRVKLLQKLIAGPLFLENSNIQLAFAPFLTRNMRVRVTVDGEFAGDFAV